MRLQSNDRSVQAQYSIHFDLYMCEHSALEWGTVQFWLLAISIRVSSLALLMLHNLCVSMSSYHLSASQMHTNSVDGEIILWSYFMHTAYLYPHTSVGSFLIHLVWLESFLLFAPFWNLLALSPSPIYQAQNPDTILHTSCIHKLLLCDLAHALQHMGLLCIHLSLRCVPLCT